MPNLNNKVCLVTGASRGIGRGIAIQLITYGATCYITGRSVEMLKLVGEEAKSRGSTGKCIPIQCDHSDDESVKKLFQTIFEQQSGQLDLLVNNAYGGVSYIIENSDILFWDQPDNSWDIINNVGLRSHYICAVHAARMMVPHRKGLIINISSVGGKIYFQLPQYGVGKAGKDRMAKDCAVDLEKYNIAFISLWPGPVKTESVMEAIEEVKKKASLTTKDKQFELLFSKGESTEYPGKCIAHLLTDPNIMKRSGQILFTSDLAAEYKFKDIDGLVPLSMRSINFALRMTKLSWVSDYLPDWLQIPKFMYMAMLNSVPSKMQRKKPSKYE